MLKLLSKIKKLLIEILIKVGLVEIYLLCFSKHPVILMYHGVELESKDIGVSGKHVEEKLFRDQLRLVKKHFKIVPLNTLIGQLGDDKRIGKRICSITFDDGYLNNYTVAKAVLEEFNVPATFFISTGFIGRDRWIWTDMVEHLYKNHTTEDIQTMLQHKVRTLDEIKSGLKLLNLAEVVKIVSSMFNEAGYGTLKPFGRYRFMNWTQVRELVKDGFEIGAHTVNHPILSNERIDDAYNEIISSKETLMNNIGICSEVFCYPNGKSSDYTQEIIEFCSKNFNAALSTNVGAAKKNDMFELKRIGVDNDTKADQLLRTMVYHATN